MTPQTQIKTQCTHLARGDQSKPGFVNPATHRGSTYLYPNYQSFKESFSHKLTAGKVAYGRYGTEPMHQLENALAQLEGGYAAMCTSTGVAAITTTMLAYLSAGDHILVVDTVFGPTRTFCDQTLSKLGVTATYYPSDMGRDIATLIQPNTRFLFLESPGSLTFEVQDLPVLIETAQAHKLTTLMDNTWATALLYPAIDKGVNVSIHAATKYIGGHSDLMMGVIVCDEENWPIVRTLQTQMGQTAGNEEVSLALRGLRTLPLRLHEQGRSAGVLIDWLGQQTLVHKLHSPTLANCPGHDIWKREFKGASSLFSFELKVDSEEQLGQFLDAAQIFGLGVSWGGYESLLMPSNPSSIRTASQWSSPYPLIRVAVGLEDTDDLIADLARCFEAIKAL